MAKDNPIINYVKILLVWLSQAIQTGSAILIGNLLGSISGALIGYWLYLKYEAGLLFQRQMARAFSIMGMQTETILRMIFFIILFAYVGAIIQAKIRGKI